MKKRNRKRKKKVNKESKRGKLSMHSLIWTCDFVWCLYEIFCVVVLWSMRAEDRNLIE